MSPLTVRRYRAERLLRQEFEALRATVIASVRGRLRASGVSLDPRDLEACYAEAWQGLYAVMLDGEDIANPAGWLTLVTFRRAIDEQRARASVLRSGAHGGVEFHALETHGAPTSVGGQDRDFAAELDDRTRLRQLFEGLRGRLNAREREAATLCYLQGLSRAEAAARMGISDARMRKLMEGSGGGGTGVAAKVGALVTTIGDGDWCEAQASLMRGLAYGIHDPDGERYKLALLHCEDCPGCRGYVLSLRGLASVLPPVLLPWGLGAEALARVGAHAGGGIGAGAAAGAGAGGGAGSAAGAGAGSSVGLVPASGVAGAGGAAGAGGSWLLAGGTFAGKLAAGCLLALGVGVGCLALSGIPDRVPVHRHHAVHAAGGGEAASALLLPAVALGQQRLAGAGAHAGASSAALTPMSRANREFGPEQELASDGVSSASSGARSAIARSASAGSGAATAAQTPVNGLGPADSSGTAELSAPAHSSQPVQPSSAEDASKAEREFAPG